MSAKLNRFAVVALAILAMALSCSKGPSPKTVATTNADNKSTQFAADSNSIGLIEHRGRFYRLEDLMNPAYRAESNDPFVRQFAPDTNVAISWAGMNPAEKERLDASSSHKSLRPLPWAGLNPGQGND